MTNNYVYLIHIILPSVLVEEILTLGFFWKIPDFFCNDTVSQTDGYEMEA